jgi:hypothetical protein
MMNWKGFGKTQVILGFAGRAEEYHENLQSG